MFSQLGRRRGRLASATVTAVLAGAVALAGCQSAVGQADQSSGPTHGGTLTITQSADIAPSTFLSQNNPNFAMIRTVYNTLTAYDHKTLRPQPELATSWQYSPDHLSITIHLRTGVTFSAGRPFTADDVLFTLNAMKRPDVTSQFKSIVNAISAMKADDPNTLTLTFGHPISNLFNLFEVMPIVDKDTFDQLLAGKQFIGTGPFKVASYTPGSEVKLVKNDHYWQPGRPYLDGIDIDIESQSQSMLSALKSGQSQLALDLAPLDSNSLKGDPNYQVIASDADDATYYVGSNVTIPPLNNPEVRQGVAWAIDRRRILDQALAGIGQTSSLPWAPSSPAYDRTKANTYSQNTAKAKQLISQAGASGATVNVAFNSGFPTNQAIAEIVQYDLNQAGLRAQLVPLQAADFFGKLGNGDMPGLYVNVHGFGQLDPATLVNGAFPFNAKKNASNFDNPTYQDLANQVWTAADPKAAYGKLNDFLLQQQFISDLVVSSHTFTVSSKLKGLTYNMYDYLDLDNAYLTH